MLAKFMRKAHISALVTPSWVAAYFVALAVLGTSTPVAMADCSPLGTWHGQWNSYDGASGSLDITIDCDGHVVGTMEWDMRPDVDCVLYFDIDTTYPPLPPGCYRGYCFEDTEYCLGIPVTLSIYSEGDCSGCDTMSGTYSGESYAGGEGPFSEEGTWTLNRTSVTEKASEPSPRDSVPIEQSINADLNWYNCGACTFDVYFGECGSMAKVSSGQDETVYIPGPLLYDTNYCWRIDGKNTNGTTTGYTWSFTTKPAPIQYQLTTSVVGGYGTIEPNDGLYDTETVLLSENFNDGNFDGWIIVDQGDQNAPSDWSATTGTLVQHCSNIYSLPAGDELPKLGTYALYDSGYNWTNYRFSVMMRSDDDDSIGVMFRYQDENNYYRFSWDKQRALRRLVKCENGSFTLLAEDNIPYISQQDYLLEIVADGSILEVYIDNTLIFSVTDTSFANGSVGLYCWGNEGGYFDDIEVTEQTIVTLTAVPDAGYCLKAWTGTDNDQSTDITNTVTMDSDRDVTVEFEECQSRWTDYWLRVRMRSEDDDSIGLMFRYQDENNYYRFSWDKQRAFRRLVKCVDGVFSLLAQDSVEYTIGQTYDVEIVADGSNIEVWVDGAQIFLPEPVINDTAFSEGTIALYCWGNAGSYFDDIIIEDLRSETMLLYEDFDDGDFEGWTIVDQGDQDVPSDWSAGAGTMVQSSNIYSLPTGPEIEKLGTFALYGGQVRDWDDLASLCLHWLELNCDNSNNWCDGTDLDFSSTVDLADFAIFSEYWLQNSGW